MHVDDTVLDRNWKALRPSLIPHVPPVTRAPRWRLPVFAGTAAAFAATVAFFVVPRLSAPPANRQTNSSTRSASNPDQTSFRDQAPTHPQAAGDDALSRLGSAPLIKAHLHTGLFRSNASQPEAPVHLLSLAEGPAPSSPTPRFTAAPAPTVPIEPVRPAWPVADQADSSGTEPGRVSVFKHDKAGGTAKAHRERTLDVMLGVGGNFIVSQTGQTASRAITALGALHQQFRPVLGYRITASYTRPDFGFSYPGNPRAGTIRINSRIYELAGTYVIQGPHHGRFKTSVDAGAGLLAFLPSSAYESTTSIFRAAGVAGANLDVALWKHWGTRFAYRAQLFRSPNFVYTDADAPVTARTTFSNEPTLGVTYTFGKQ